MNKLEKDIEKALITMVKRHGGLCLKWVSPGFSGVPDRIILLPRGRVIFAELKRPNGDEPRKLQQYWHRKIRALGFQCWIIYSQADIENLEERL